MLLDNCGRDRAHSQITSGNSSMNFESGRTETGERQPLSQTPARGGRTRRRFIGAAGSAGVLLAVQARTALGAGICQSPSAAVSGNTSPRPNDETCTGGRSPGFWKQPQKFGYWTDAGAVPPEFNVTVSECLIGQKELTLANIKTPGTLVEFVLPGASVPAGTGCWAVLAFPTNFGSDGQLLRHLVAAWLNAGAFPDYPITREVLLNMWLAIRDRGLYCPSNVSCDDSTGMDADEIKNYIEGMYDDPPLEKKICTSDTTNGAGGKKR